MKIAKLSMGIASIALFLVIMFQFCVPGFASASPDADLVAREKVGALFAASVLIAGVSGIMMRGSKEGSAIAAILYLISSLVGFSCSYSFEALRPWSVIMLIFCAIFVFDSVKALLGERFRFQIFGRFW